MKKDKYKVVLVDDDKWLLDLYGQKLRLEDFEVYTASNGKEGLDAVKKFQPDLIISDVVMPQGDGYSLLKNVKKDKAIAKIPVINLTNLANNQDQLELERLGSDGYLVKADYTPTQAVERIKKMIAQFDMRRGLS